MTNITCDFCDSKAGIITARFADTRYDDHTHVDLCLPCAEKLEAHINRMKQHKVDELIRKGKS